MLIIFAFSVTPTILLHNWTANHTDSVKKITDTGQQQLSKKLFNCHCDNIVAESPFTEIHYYTYLPVEQKFTNIIGQPCIDLSLVPQGSVSLRGPPSV
jgi:hypothetical protein